ncbi:TRAP transporter small permease [uncultured Ruegeria sp.]|uniref:TRAP transporter small permease n=1 Tax=uncultured Ruegeria sp. TaxID=259304 RepID=UPI00261A679E|nr:TRAP transporter small permease subunit [uncultured Ruegeria sp.]
MADNQKPRLRDPWYVVLHLPTWIAASTLFVLMCMTFLDVVLRSAFDNPIESATELTRLFMAIIVFSALPLVSWKGENIVVDLLDPFFSERLALMRDSLIDAVCGIVLVWPAVRVWELAERSRRYGDVTEYLKLPQFYVGWFISIFVALTAIAFLARSVVRLIHKTEDAE